MTRDEAVAQIQQILVWRGDRTNEIIAGLKFQQQDAEEQATLPWFLREEDTSLVTVVDNELLAPPTGFIREWDEDALYVKHVDVSGTGQEEWVPLVKDSPRYLRTSINNYTDPATSDARIPIAYSWDGTNFRLFPTPDDVYEMRMIYYKKDALLDTDIENKWLKHLPYLLIGKAGLVIATAFRDQIAMQVFAGMAAQGTKQLNDVTTDRDNAGNKPVIGGAD